MFTNHQIDVTSLPRIEDVELEPISPKYFKVILFNTIIAYLSFIVALICMKFFIEDSDDGFHTASWYIIAVLIIVCLFQITIYKLGFKKRKYGLREQDVIYSSGYLYNNTTTLPLNRIQHIEIKVSFIARKLGLATLKIYSAGESGGDIAIKGLPKTIANAKYAYLTKVLNDRV